MFNSGFSQHEINIHKQTVKAHIQRIKIRLKRTFFEFMIEWLERILATMLMFVLAPFIFFRGLLSLLLTTQLFNQQAVTGRHGIPFNLLTFTGDIVGRRAAYLINIIKGELAIVGPRIKRSNNAEILGVRPGLFSLYSLRKRVCIAHVDELNADREYIYLQSIKSNCGILLRNIIALLLGGATHRPTPDHIDFFGISVCNISMENAVNSHKLRRILVRQESAERLAYSLYASFFALS